MTQYLIVRVGGEELDVPYGNLTPGAPVEVDIRDGCPSTHEGVYVVSMPLADFKPAYEELAGLAGPHVDLDMTHTRVAKPKTRIETPSDHLIDMFLGHGKSMMDSARFSTGEALPNQYSREDVQVRLLLDSGLTPEQLGGITAKIFSEKRRVGMSDARLWGLDIGGYRVATSQDFRDPFYLHYMAPDGTEGYAEVAPKLRKFLRMLVKAD